MSSSKIKPFLIDSRIVQRNINVGRIERKTYEDHISSLKDLTDYAVDIGEKIYNDNQPAIALAGDFTKEEKNFE